MPWEKFHQNFLLTWRFETKFEVILENHVFFTELADYSNLLVYCTVIK